MNEIIETNENIELNDYSNCVDEKSWSVYLHTVPKEISGYDWDKYYVGITSMAPSKRWGNNGIGYKGQVFYNAIKKYGWDNIKHEILATNLTKEEAENFEIILIKELHSNNYKYGYNVANGGNTIGKHSEETIEKIRLSNKRRKLSKETKKKISESNKGKILTESHKLKISNSLMGEKNHFFGKKHTEETLKKMKTAQTGSKNHNSKKVICDGIVFNSIKECADYYDVNDKVMRNWLSGTRKMKQEFFDMGLKYLS